MTRQSPRSCQCDACRTADGNRTSAIHALMNYFLSTLDHRRQRLYVGLEAVKRGPGSERGLALITGWTVEEIQSAREAIERELAPATTAPQDSPIGIGPGAGVTHTFAYANDGATTQSSDMSWLVADVNRLQSPGPKE